MGSDSSREVPPPCLPKTNRSDSFEAFITNGSGTALTGEVRRTIKTSRSYALFLKKKFACFWVEAGRVASSGSNPHSPSPPLTKVMRMNKKTLSRCNYECLCSTWSLAPMSSLLRGQEPCDCGRAVSHRKVQRLFEQSAPHGFDSCACC